MSSGDGRLVIISMNESEKRSAAWVGDAVLALFARQWILGQSDIEPGQRIEIFTGMTSNRFLACLGEPTAIEASIGKVYLSEGLEAAFTHIESELLPVFAKQRQNWRRGRKGSRVR